MKKIKEFFLKIVIIAIFVIAIIEVFAILITLNMIGGPRIGVILLNYVQNKWVK